MTRDAAPAGSLSEDGAPATTEPKRRFRGITADLSALFDDGASGQAVALAAGEWAGWRFPAPRAVTDVTMTAVQAAAAGSWIWEASEDGSEWRPVPTTHTEPLIPARTTPFALETPVVARMLRVRAVAPLALAQLELFDLAGLDDGEDT